jgi:hypothetical protein
MSGPFSIAGSQTLSVLNWVDPTPAVASTLNSTTGVFTQTGVGVDAKGIPTAGTLPGSEPYSNPKNEIGFKIFQDASALGNVPTYTQTTSTVKMTQVTDTGKITAGTAAITTKEVLAHTTTVPLSSQVIATTPANVTSWTGVMPIIVVNSSQVVPPSSKVTTTRPAQGNGIVTWNEVTTTTPGYTIILDATSYTYQAVGYNAAGHFKPAKGATAPTSGLTAAAPITSNVALAPVLTGPAGPSGLVVTPTATGATLSWIGVAGATGYTVNGAALATLPPCDPVTGVCTLAVTTGLTTGNNNFSVSATTLSGTTAASSTSLNGTVLPPVGLTEASKSAAAINGLTGSSVSLTWANDSANVNNVTGLTLGWTGGKSATFAANSTGTTVVGLTAGNYVFTLVANSPLGNATATPISVTVP